MSNNAHDLSNRLLNALDNNYNVVDMHAVNEIISILEKFNITKELLETTRLGKHVNELRRKTTEPTLARRAKVLVKRWRDLVIPTRASPAHTGSTRSSAERQMRRLGGTPLTSPALARHVVSPAVSSPRPPSRPAWGGYESDSQDVILVDDEPEPAPLPAPPPPPPPAPTLTLNTHKATTAPVKRPLSPEPHDDKKAKRDKKPKKKRGHSRAGSGTEAASGAGVAPPPPAAPPAGWGARNGAHTERRRNGCRKGAVDPYAALANKIPQPGAKKVRTTRELLEDIQSRGSKPLPSPGSPDDDVVVVEDACPLVNSPLRNGSSDRPPTPPAPVTPLPPLEDPREYHDCTCGEEVPEDDCPAARRSLVLPTHIHALHHTYLPGINGTRAPTHPHQYAVRKLTDPEKPGLFTSVVPLYKYSDYADDYCTKNMSRVPLCTHLPWTDFAPAPPDLPEPPSPPPMRPYPIEPTIKEETDAADSEVKVKLEYNCPIQAEMVSVPNLEPSERLKAPLLSTEEVTQLGVNVVPSKLEVEDDFKSEQQEHRTVERTKTELDGRALYSLCEKALESVPFGYSQTSTTPVVSLPENSDETVDVLAVAFENAAADSSVDDFGRPPRSETFTEWHECAKLGDLIALPYVVID